MIKKTSLIGSMPGGLNEMVLLVSEIGGNERIVTLLNTTRIIIVVTIVSILKAPIFLANAFKN